MIRLARLVLPLLLLGCSPEKAIQAAMAPGEQQRAERLMNEVARGDRLTKGLLDPQIELAAGPVLPATRAEMPQPPLAVKLLAYRTSISGDRMSSALYEISGGGRYALADVTTRTHRGKSDIVGLKVQRLPGPADEQNRFTFSGKSFGYYAMLLAMVAAFGTIVAALVRIWRSGRFHRRWLWTIGALFGVTTFALNWTTGQFDFRPFTFNLLGAGFIKNPIFAPWILTFGIPVVAIIALFKHRGDGWQSEEKTADPV